MKHQTILKSILCLLMALVCNVTWAQDVPVKQTTAPADGYYLMYSESSSGNGWVHYDKSLAGRKFRVATDVDLTNGLAANQAKYVWKLVNDNENGTFTLQNVGEDVYMPADASHGGNMGATTTANLKITAVGGDGNEGKWYVAQTNNKFDGQDLYIHTNTPGGYPNLSYWEGCSLNGTSIRAQFYKVPEATYTLKFFSGEELVATSNLVYPAGIEMSENLISDAVPVGYRFLNYTFNETTYTVQVTPEAFLTVSNLDHGVNYPYTLSEEQETAVFGKELLTIAMDVTMGGTSNNEAFICASDVSVTSDNTTYDNNSTFVAVGTQNGCIRLFASAKSNGYYSGNNSQLVAARNHKVVIVIDSKNKTRKVYVDGGASTASHFQDFYHFRENENAHIYIGGGKNSAGDKYKFSGIVHSVQFFEGALTVDQLSHGIEYPETAGKAILAKAVTTNANMNIYGMQRLLGLVQNAGVGLNGDGQISCNFPANTSQENGNAYDNLLDGEYTTFFHSGYNNAHGSTLGDALHYLQFSLNKPTKIFRFYYKKRSQNNNNRPTKITIQGSNDAQTWNDVSVISSGLPTDGALTDYFSEKITSPKAYRHYRFTINTTNSGASNGISFFSFSEFYLLPNSDRVNEVFDAVRAYRASATVANAETLNNVWNNGLPIVGEAQYIFANAKQSDGTYAAHYLYNNNGALATSNAPEGDKYAWIAVQPEGTTYYTFQNVSDPTKYISYGNNGNGIGVGNEGQKVQFDIRSSSDFIVHSNSVGLKRVGTDNAGKWMVTAAAGNSFNRNSGKVNDGSWTSDYLFVPANIYDGIRINCAEEFVNGEVYTFVTARGWMGAKNDNNNVISTAKASHGLTGSDEDPMFQWSVYKSKNGYYYLYNLGKEQFMGVQSSNNTSIPFAATPNNRKFTFKESSSSTHPIMFSTDNAGVANHSKDRGDGLITWTGGWNTLNDEGSNHQVTLVDKLTEANLTTIAEAVEAYEAELKSQAIEALGTAITTAQPKRNGMGGELGYYSSSDVNATTTFDAIVEFKNSITDETTINAIEGHTKTVNELFTLNVPQPGKFYRFKRPGQNVYMLSDVYTNNNNRLAMGTSTYSSIFYYGEDGTLLSYAIGQYLPIAAKNGNWTCLAVGSTAPTVTFGAGYNLGTLGFYLGGENYNDRAYYSGNWNSGYVNAGGSIAANDGYDWTVEEVTSLPVTISGAGYTTLFAPTTLEIPSTVEAYVVSEVQSSSVLLEQVTGVVPAETGLIIKGDEGSYSFSIGGDVTAEITANELKGTVAKSLITPDANTTCYVLANGSKGVGLYKASLNKNENTAFLNNAFKAYISVAAGQSAPALAFRFGRGGNDEGTTDLEKSEIINHKSEMIFDLTGRRIEKIVEKGIYIVNGKKVVIR